MNYKTLINYTPAFPDYLQQAKKTKGEKLISSYNNNNNSNKKYTNSN